MNGMTVGRSHVEAERTETLRQRRASIKPSDNEVYRVIPGLRDLKKYRTRTASQRDRIRRRSSRSPRRWRSFPRHHRVEDHLDPPGAGGTRLYGEPVFPRLQFMLDQGDGQSDHVRWKLAPVVAYAATRFVEQCE